ncbi:MAG: polyprenyl synthetase family protein [Prevotellaceae bacterium]|jgi:octaprenyl-diphosphate synthase|nr:polyprenyl synthetase family protein [Prevotellaceae bacterium]
MTADLEQLKQSLGNHWKGFSDFFQQALLSDIVLLNTINRYLLQHAGKQLRPLLTLLTAEMLGKITESTYLAASAVEMVHTCSLLHDDVIDNADERRGAPSVKAMWRSNASVLTGDYWLSRIFHMVITHQEYRLLPWFSGCLVNLSEGELLQLEKALHLSATEAGYFTIIGKKTASLLAVSMASGAITADAPAETVQQLYDAGYQMGLAFQIRDDILDYHKTNMLGKPTGNDLREQKLTLPLLHALAQADEPTRAKVLKWVKSVAKSKRHYTKIISFVKAHHGMEYAHTVLQQHVDKAKEILASFPENEGRNKLMGLVDFLAVRKK